MDEFDQVCGDGLYCEMNDEIESICLKCGDKKLIPDFIYDECSRFIVHDELNGKKASTIYCNVCEKLKMVPISYLDEKIK